MILSKSLSFLLIVVICMLTASLYGVLHDQVTYSISPEYYTKFKFYQFGIMDDSIKGDISNPRAWVSVVGVLATWWMGFWIGLVLAIVGLAQSTWKKMLSVTWIAILITITTALFVALSGLAYGFVVLAHQSKGDFSNWYIPDNIIDLRSYIAVGSMHNFSYLGGLIGLIGAVFYSVRKAKTGRVDILTQAA